MINYIYPLVGSEKNIDVQLTEDAVWLNQRQMAELFDKDVDIIGLHIRNMYKEGELKAGATTEESSVVQEEAAESKPDEKGMMFKGLVNLINSKN